MVSLPPIRGDRLRVSPMTELEHAPRAVVRFGTAPDGLPWLLAVDRSQRLAVLLDTVTRVFELDSREELPERVRTALAAGLMGIYDVELDDGAARVYVSRKKARQVLGATLMTQLLERDAPELPDEHDLSVNTSVGAVAIKEQDLRLLEQVEDSIEQRRTRRHLLLQLDDGRAFTGGVKPADRVLRKPRAPFRPLVFESLASVGAEALVTSAGGEPWRVPVAQGKAYVTALHRIHQDRHPGQVDFEVPRARLLAAVCELADGVAALHARGLVHADLAPGNVLLADDGARCVDSLDVPIGTPSTAATFEWAAPEQIVGHPVDPRTDVFALGKLATAILGGVAFGEETSYVVPVGGARSRRVQLLKAEGVFLDVLETTHSRAWQAAWQDLLGRAVAFDPAKRPADARSFARELAALLEAHPPEGALRCPGRFGTPVAMEAADAWTFARRADD
ncbi:MAG: protein kinase [Kofleriaceae bacterium]